MPLFINRAVAAVKECVIYIIICGCVFVGFFVCGFIIARGNDNEWLCENASAFLQGVFSQEQSFAAYFFSKLFAISGVLIIIALSGIIIWLLPLHLVLIAYISLVVGAALNAFFNALSLGGVLIYVLVFLPSFLLRMCAIIFLSAASIAYYKERRDCNIDFDFGVLIGYFLVSAVLCAVAVLYEALMLFCVISPFGIYF